MVELDDLAEAVSDVLAKKEELRPLGKEIVEELEPEQRKKLYETLSEMAVDVLGDFKVAVLAPDTKVAIPENELHQSGHNPDELEELTVPERVDVLEHVEWARDWASAMAEKFGMPETAEEREELERHALEYLATEAWV